MSNYIENSHVKKNLSTFWTFWNSNIPNFSSIERIFYGFCVFGNLKILNDCWAILAILMKQKLHFLGSHLLVFLKIINIELPSYNRLWGIYGTHKKENPMNHLPLIELSIISQEFSFVKSRTREFGGLALTANKWPKKSSAENHREMLQRQQQKGNQQQCLNGSKKISL